jgi:hypothetical protein
MVSLPDPAYSIQKAVDCPELVDGCLELMKFVSFLAHAGPPKRNTLTLNNIPAAREESISNVPLLSLGHGIHE